MNIRHPILWGIGLITLGGTVVAIDSAHGAGSTGAAVKSAVSSEINVAGQVPQAFPELKAQVIDPAAQGLGSAAGSVANMGGAAGSGSPTGQGDPATTTTVKP